MTPRQLFVWAYFNLTNVNVILVIEDQYREEEKLIRKVFNGQPNQWNQEPKYYIARQLSAEP
jgi:hypothetical protein